MVIVSYKKKIKNAVFSYPPAHPPLISSPKMTRTKHISEYRLTVTFVLFWACNLIISVFISSASRQFTICAKIGLGPFHRFSLSVSFLKLSAPPRCALLIWPSINYLTYGRSNFECINLVSTLHVSSHVSLFSSGKFLKSKVFLNDLFLRSSISSFLSW